MIGVLCHVKVTNVISALRQVKVRVIIIIIPIIIIIIITIVIIITCCALVSINKHVKYRVRSAE